MLLLRPPVNRRVRLSSAGGGGGDLYLGYTPTIYAAPALKVEIPRQRTAAQMAAEMASAERAAVAKRRAVEAGVEAQRARVEIQKLQPELMQRRQQASYRVIEQLLRQA